MRNRIKLLLRKKGFTLVEMLVVLVVSSILLGIAMGMLRPVTSLLNTLKGNAHMDAVSNTGNEYIRGCMEKAVAVSVVPYSKLNDLKDSWKDFTTEYTKADGYSVRAIGVMGNYNGDFRIYDFGEVNVIGGPDHPEHTWTYDSSLGNPVSHNSAGESPAGTAFVTLIENRDGGGRDHYVWGDAQIYHGYDGNEFHRFDAFNEEFYSNGATGSLNYSFEVAFEVKEKTITEGDTTVTGVSYLTIYSQIFKRTGNLYSGDESEKKLKFEPANQIKSLSFKLFNGTAKLDVSNDVNTVETDISGTKTIKLATDESGDVKRDGLVILYVVRDSY